MNSGYFIQFTKEGYAKLKQEYEDLIAQRPEAVENLKRAREMGDLKENGYYKASRMKLNSIDNRLFHLKILLKRAKIAVNTSATAISIGCIVILKHENIEKQYQIVNKYETNPSEGKVSDVSPIGSALMGKKMGDTVKITIPSGEVIYKIVKIII